MTRPLVTRRDRKTFTSRARIRDAALACLMEDGYARASSLAIQRRAGISRGGLLHHYPSRSDLLVEAVLEHEMMQAVAAAGAGEVMAHLDGSEARIGEAVDMVWVNFRALFFRAATELWAAAVHDAELRVALEPAERKVNRAVHDAVALMFGATHAAHPGFPALRDMLLTSMRGLAVADAFSGIHLRHDRHLTGWKTVARATLLQPG